MFFTITGDSLLPGFVGALFPAAAAQFFVGITCSPLIMNSMQIYRINWNSLPWITPMPEVRFKAVEQNGQKLRMVEFSHGFTEPDWCCKGHIGYVLDGEGELQLIGRTVSLKAGDGIFIPAGEEHKHMLHVIGARFCVVLVEEAQAQPDHSSGRPVSAAVDNCCSVAGRR